MSDEQSAEMKETLTLYREAVRRHEKMYLYDHSQPAGPDLGYDRMVEWTSEADRAFVQHLYAKEAQLKDKEALIKRLVEAIESGEGIKLRPRADVDAIDEWWLRMNALVAEWQAMKGGEE